MSTFEKLGAFYLGRLVDRATGNTTDETILYDAKDLTTHAVCVGMTGSGKTGLCVSLIEEAAIDGVPVIAIDPKGDLGNLCLTFPGLRPAEFEPWVDEGEALRKGATPKEYAKKIASLWKNGLAGWGQDGARIERLRNAAEVSIYTPGSDAGIPISVIRSLSAPAPAIAADAEAIGERVSAAVSGLLALLGIDADPIRSREHILLSNIVHGAWREGRSLEIPDLIHAIQDPPFARVGVLDLDSFFPASERAGLAMMLNNLLASPGFASWMEGEPLDIGRLLRNADGKPKISILSIAHLSESERMFFVTVLLNELVAWMRTQPGTSSLRAILYMDEIFGYFPPVANPPSKRPMLTLLKQARAYGLGCVLATQNPADLDYKGLSNTGTWFLGRLQAERDLERVLDGLEGAAAAVSGGFDRAEMERTIAGLGSRVFMMNNVHDDGPVLFHTRWAMSYLRGPLTRTQIKQLMASKKSATTDPIGPAKGEHEAVAESVAGSAGDPPPLPPDVPEKFVPVRADIRPGDRLLYRPALLGKARLHFVAARFQLDYWTSSALRAALVEDAADPWSDAEKFAIDEVALQSTPDSRAGYASLAAEAGSARSWTRWKKQLAGAFYRTVSLSMWKCTALKETSQPGESEGEFRGRLDHAAREHRDLTAEKLRQRYAPKLARLEQRIRTAEQRVEKEREQFDNAKLQTAISIGAGVLGALFGRKIASSRNVGRAATAARGAGRAAKQKGDIGRAQDTLDDLRVRLADMEEEFQQEVELLEDKIDASQLELTEKVVRPRKSDIDVLELALLWAPWKIDGDGIAEPAW